MNEKRETVALTFDLPHAPEKVWRALTEPNLLARWLMKTDLHPTVGRTFQFRMEPSEYWNGIVDCEIVAVQEARFLSYAWRALGVDTVVSWTLEPTSTGTHLKFEQTGFKSDQKQAFAGARAAWTKMAGDALPKVLTELS
jgi:uncharacterized protein YndB with AHSA1/START domain